jgi:hypothetical protein
MPRFFALACLLLGLALVLPASSADDNDDKKKNEPAPKKVEAGKDKEDAPKDKDADKDKKDAAKKKDADKEKKEKLTWGQELIGKLTFEGNSQKDFTLHVTQKIMEPDFGAQQQFARQQYELQQQQLRMATARRPQDLAQAQQQYLQTLNQLAQTQNRLFRPKDLKFDVPLRFAEKVKVRLLNPPIDYDDKGNVKRYTAKELKELQGTEGLPGFTGDLDALRNGQIVKVFLAKNAAAKAVPPGKGAPPRKKKADEDEDEVGMARPEAVMIMVLQDTPVP